MGMNGAGPKTIGRTKPQADTQHLEDIAQAQAEVERGVAGAMTTRERAFHLENVSLKRELAVSRARVAMLTMGGDKKRLCEPVAGTFERMQALEAAVLATDDMTKAAKLRTLAQMVAAVRAFAKAREKYLREVEANVADKLGSDQ